METTKSKLLKLNNMVTKSHIEKNDKRKRYYQSLINWIISKEIK